MTENVIEVNTVVCARNDLLASELSEDELVMMDLDKGLYFGLEDVANAIWRCIAEPLAVSAICEKIASEFDADEKTVRRDTIDFLTEMHRENLITIVPATDSA